MKLCQQGRDIVNIICRIATGNIKGWVTESESESGDSKAVSYSIDYT